MADGTDSNGTPGGYLVLARKYRPQTFSDLVGQEHVVRTLANAIEQNRIHHAYLFTGSRGLGKTSTARILAKALNCEQGPTPEPCGECPACQQIAGGQGGESYILNEIDGASNRTVDDARELRRTIGQKTGGRFHVIIIDEVHMLTTEAFNTLLKTLEEPPPHVKFVFATTEVQKVPETIISRCQRLDFRRIPAGTIAEYVGEIAGREGIEAEPEALKLIARIAEGGMRDSLSKLDQAIAFCGANVTSEDVERIFGILSRRNLLELVGAFVDRDFATALDAARRVHEEGLDISQVMRDLIDLFRDVVVVQACGADTPLVDAMSDDRDLMNQVAGRLETDTVLYAVEILLEGLARIRSTGFPRLVLEMTFIKLCELDDLVALPALVEAVAAGGAGLQAAAPIRAATPAAKPAPAPARGGGERSDESGPPPDAPPGAKKRSFAADLKKSLGEKEDKKAPAAKKKSTTKKKTDLVERRSPTEPAPEPAPQPTPPAREEVPTPEPEPAPPPELLEQEQSRNPELSTEPAKGGSSNSGSRRVGSQVIKDMKSAGANRNAGIATRLREQDSVQKLLEGFEGEIIRVEESGS